MRLDLQSLLVDVDPGGDLHEEIFLLANDHSQLFWGPLKNLMSRMSGHGAIEGSIVDPTLLLERHPLECHHRGWLSDASYWPEWYKQSTVIKIL
jgi:hypothetical protein